MGPELQAHQVEGLPLGWGHLAANWGHRLRPAVPEGAALQALPIRSATVAYPLMGMLTYPLQPSTTSEISGRELPPVIFPQEGPNFFRQEDGPHDRCRVNGIALRHPRQHADAEAQAAHQVLPRRPSAGRFDHAHRVNGSPAVLGARGRELGAPARAAGAADKAHQIEGLAG